MATDIEVELGVRLLDMIRTNSQLRKERHDRIRIVDHTRIKQETTITIALAEYADAHGGLRTHHNRVLLPLITMGPVADEIPHVANEDQALMPRYPDRDVARYLGAGLVGYARRTYHLSRLDPNLERELVRIPGAVQLGQTRTVPQVLDSLIDLSPAHSALLPTDDAFRSALTFVLRNRYLVIMVDPARAPFRSFRFEVSRHCDPPARNEHPWRSAFYTALGESGEMEVEIPLPGVGGTDNYVLQVEAPTETYFSHPRAIGFSDQMEVSHTRTSLTARIASPETECSGVLRVTIAAEPTGVIRAATWGSGLVLGTCILGALVVTVNGRHDVPGTDDGTAALLVLFPGLVASVLSRRAEHLLTATFQYASRFVLCTLSAGMFILAATVALGLRGLPNIAVWWSAATFALICFVSLFARFDRLRR